MIIMHCVNDNENNFVKKLPRSLLDTLQSKNMWFWLKKCQPNHRNLFLIDLAEKVLITVCSEWVEFQYFF